MTEFNLNRYGLQNPQDKLLPTRNALGSIRSALQKLPSLAPAVQLRAIHALTNKLERQESQLQQHAALLNAACRKSNSTLDDMRDQLFDLMLAPLTELFAGLPRQAAELSDRHQKKIQLLISGEAVELNQQAAAILTEPMRELLNNALIHGIESPEQRRSLGKPEYGQLTVAAMADAGRVTIDVIDDGGGIDATRVGEQAVAQGLIRVDGCAAMLDEEKLELIFLPGYHKPDPLSGRQVSGLQLLQQAVSSRSGRLELDSEQGKGTRIRISIPAVAGRRDIRLFSIGGQTYAMAASDIVACIPLVGDDVVKQSPFSDGSIQYRQRRVPIIELTGGGAAVLSTAQLLIIHYLSGYIALVVDSSGEVSRLQIRPLEPYLASVVTQELAGCVVEDDSIVLVLSPAGLYQRWFECSMKNNTS